MSKNDDRRESKDAQSLLSMFQTKLRDGKLLVCGEGICEYVYELKANPHMTMMSECPNAPQTVQSTPIIQLQESEGVVHWYKHWEFCWDCQNMVVAADFPER